MIETQIALIIFVAVLIMQLEASRRQIVAIRDNLSHAGRCIERSSSDAVVQLEHVDERVKDVTHQIGYLQEDLENYNCRIHKIAKVAGAEIRELTSTKNLEAVSLHFQEILKASNKDLAATITGHLGQMVKQGKKEAAMDIEGMEKMLRLGQAIQQGGAPAQQALANLQQKYSF